MGMKLPEIGESITTSKALGLCRHFGLEYLVERIEADPSPYEAWVFDGCSTLPNEVVGFFNGCDWKTVNYKCCLPHDLCYAYGKPGYEIERDRADHIFYDNLMIKAGMRKWCAAAFLTAVRVGGPAVFGKSFGWAFAHKQTPQR
jgi:hypothetical protein